MSYYTVCDKCGDRERFERDDSPQFIGWGVLEHGTLKQYAKGKPETYHFCPRCLESVLEYIEQTKK